MGATGIITERTSVQERSTLMEPTSVPKYFMLTPVMMGVLIVIKDGLLYPVGTSALIGEGWVAFSLLLVRGVISKIIDISDVKPALNDSPQDDPRTTETTGAV